MTRSNYSRRNKIQSIVLHFSGFTRALHLPNWRSFFFFFMCGTNNYAWRDSSTSAMFPRNKTNSIRWGTSKNKAVNQDMYNYRSRNRQISHRQTTNLSLSIWCKFILCRDFERINFIEKSTYPFILNNNNETWRNSCLRSKDKLYFRMCTCNRWTLSYRKFQLSAQFLMTIVTSVLQSRRNEHENEVSRYEKACGGGRKVGWTPRRLLLRVVNNTADLQVPLQVCESRKAGLLSRRNVTIIGSATLALSLWVYTPPSTSSFNHSFIRGSMRHE